MPSISITAMYMFSCLTYMTDYYKKNKLENEKGWLVCSNNLQVKYAHNIIFTAKNE